jgi:tRNA pseudouridine55 synthase
VDVSEHVLRQALADLQGVHRLPVSAYSAIKKDGKKMYERARAAAKIGDVVKDVPYRDMEVFSVEWRGAKWRDNMLYVQATFHVASGVYIRSLAEELGRRVGYPAALAALRRTKIGPYSITAAQKLHDF